MAFFTGGRFAACALGIGGLHPAYERADDRLHHAILHGENLVRDAVEFFAPDMTAGVGIDQLDADTDPVACAPDAASDHRTNVQIAGHLLDVDCDAAVAECGRARPYRQQAPARQFDDDVLGDAIAEIFLCRIAAHIGERQHADLYARGIAAGRCGRRAAVHGQRWRPAPGDYATECAQHFLDLRAPVIVGPLIEFGRMQGAQVDWQHSRIESHASGGYGVGRPHDEHRAAASIAATSGATRALSLRA
jgi:hypothetical protein